MTNLADLLNEVEQFPDASPEQHVAARAIFNQQAPDLIEMVWGTSPWAS